MYFSQNKRISFVFINLLYCCGQSIVLCLLLVSGSAVYFRRKRTVSTAGFASGRVQSNSRF